MFSRDPPFLLVLRKGLFDFFGKASFVSVFPLPFRSFSSWDLNAVGALFFSVTP